MRGCCCSRTLASWGLCLTVRQLGLLVSRKLAALRTAAFAFYKPLGFVLQLDQKPCKVCPDLEFCFWWLRARLTLWAVLWDFTAVFSLINSDTAHLLSGSSYKMRKFIHVENTHTHSNMATEIFLKLFSSMVLQPVIVYLDIFIFFASQHINFWLVNPSWPLYMYIVVISSIFLFWIIVISVASGQTVMTVCGWNIPASQPVCALLWSGRSSFECVCVSCVWMWKRERQSPPRKRWRRAV